MKKLYTIVSIILAICFLAGCESSNPSPLSASTSETAIVSAYTKEDVIGYFKNLEYGKNCTVTDCVLANDFAYDLLGVVQYTDEHGKACNLSFISKNKSGAPIGLDAEGNMTMC